MSSNENDPYGAINFGEYRKYMQNKQSKLKQQEKEIQDQSSQEFVQIFTGTSIYINGYTSPPSAELRRLIIQHGGDYQHYLKKSSVTHIIATNLTNSKFQEFRSYKVVKSEWITESIQAQRLLPWQNYRLVPVSSNQKELGFSKADLTGEKLNAKLLSNNWARQTTTVNPNFLKRYYETSRLHYLSTWKNELKDIIDQLETKKTVDQKQKRHSTRIVMHIDFDCFFASVGIKDRPHLIDKPVAVTHSTSIDENSSSEIASCNYVARSFGVRNGMMCGKAKRMCPDLQVIPYEFEKYKATSKIFYNTVYQYADELQAVSVDEVLIEVGSHFTTVNHEEILQFSNTIRNEIKLATGCEVSIGIGPNILLARLSTKRAKPAGQYYCKTQQDIDDLLCTQNVTDLPGVGYAIREKLEDLNVIIVSDLRNISLSELQTKLGSKLGKMLHDFAYGIDDRPLITDNTRKSVSAEVTWGVRFESEENEKEFLHHLSTEVSDRLKMNKVKGKSITLKVSKRRQGAAEASKYLGRGEVDTYAKSTVLNHYTDDSEIINKHTLLLLEDFQFPFAEIRGLGIHITKLNNLQELSPDQGKLNFTIPKEKHTIKQHLDVDYDVYKELPDSIQQEISTTFNIQFQESKSKDPIIITPTIASQPEIPPWSQLDPSVLLELPDQLREQILKAYKSNSICNQQLSSQIQKSSRTPKNANISQVFKRTDQVETDQIELIYDADVWEELPKDVQAELLEEYRLAKEVDQMSHLEAISEPKYDQEPSLEGMKDINHIRNMLKEWTIRFEKPVETDVAIVTEYLVDLVNYADLEKVKLILVYLDYLIKDLSEASEWRMSVDKIHETACNQIMKNYGCTLK